ncbi:TonB-dependent receptor [Stakelama marina]|uniref:TonB-dependent receptor n=1 Tax=Stakelama marina TaxID=2826939 RepID=A0A8T4IJV2_9SPHN|nr:TonB-dependent receptor [Stakelama marina]MBR0552629.1 TonB-dependent receptor [Stakelama marina]
MRKTLLLASAAALFALPAHAQTAQSTGSDNSGAQADSGSQNGQDIVVTGHLDEARASVQPSLGATTYAVTNDTIQSLPGGDNVQLDKLVLQLPGVVQDGFGQFHVRGDHGNLQYRINGTILPEGVSSFGQTLSPRIVQNFDLRTGALPAQYGLRTAGIIDITTKNSFDNSGQISLYGGSHDTIQPSFDYGGSSGATNFFVTGSYLHNNLGIEAVSPDRHQIHDRTDQFQGFAYVDHTIGANDRVSLMGGYADQKFQIPNPRGLHPDSGYNVGGVTDFLSNDLNEHQHERTGFAIASYLHDAGRLTLQASLFGRYSGLDYYPDPLGDLLFNGIAQRATKQDFTAGTQVEAVYRLSDAHTLRGGVIVSRDRRDSKTSAQVFPVDDMGNQIGQPITIVDNGADTEWTYSAYLQDEWKLADSFTVNFGARFDRYNGVRSEQQLSPRINIVWQPSAGTTFHAGYSRYFSPPPFSNVADTTIAKFVGTSAAAPALTGDAPYAERQDYFDIGLAQTLTPDLSLTLDAYHRRSRNLIDEGQFGAPIILTPFNFARGKIDGAEANLSYRKRGWTLYGNLAYSKAQGRGIVSGQFNFDPADLAYIDNHYIFLDHDQRWTGSAGATYRFDSGALYGTTLGASMLYGSGLRKDGAVPNGGKLPPYATFNLSASHKFDGPGIAVRFDVINAFDHVYEIRDGSGIGVGAPQYGERRSFYVGITKDF